MAYYQFSLPMTAGEAHSLVRSVCEKSCTIKRDCPGESIEVKTKFRMGKGPLPFLFFFKEQDGQTEIIVSSDNSTLLGAVATMGNKEEVLWDLADREWSDMIEDFRAVYPEFPLKSGKPSAVKAAACDDGIGQESVSRGKNFSLGRAAVGGLLMGTPGAFAGGLSGVKQNRTQTRNVFSTTVLFQVLYSNGRLIEKTVKKNSREYAELIAKSV